AAIARRIILLEIVERGVGKHDAKAESIIGPVAFIERDLGLRPLLLQQDRSIETGRPTTDDRDFHERLRSGHYTKYFKPKIFGDKPRLREPRLNSPERPVSLCSRKQRMRARSRPSSCKAPAPPPLPRPPPRPTSPIPWPACAWSWCWRRSDLQRSGGPATALQPEPVRA